MTAPWPSPADLPYAFVHERSHFPGPVRELDFALNVKAMEHGFNIATGEYELPLRLVDLHVNGFVYEALVTTGAPPAARTAVCRPAASVLEVAIDELPRLWSDEWLPALQSHLEFWQDFDLSKASDSELRAHFGETRERSLDMWVVHFRLLVPLLVGINRFRALATEVFDDWAPDDVTALLTGMPSKTTEGDDELWRLGRELHADPELASALTAPDWPAVRQALEGSNVGRAFLGHLETYLHDYGRRGSDWSLDHPFWIEDPGPVLAILRTYARAGASRRRESRRWTEQRRLELEAACAQRLGEAPHPLPRAFHRFQQSARTATWLSEESYHWIEGLGSYSVRQVCLEAGRRLTDAGVLVDPDDVFHLQPDEVAGALGGTDRETVARRAVDRKAELVCARSLDPPPVLGPSGGAMPPPSEIGEAFDLLFGVPAEPSDDATDLHGQGASPGIARGTVRIIRTLDEVDKVRAGDVLVATTTSPDWTPLFHSIVALVTDTGGVLCHAAVVAREYGLPAVVGASGATRLLQDGQRVEVDGRAGTVTLVDDPIE